MQPHRPIREAGIELGIPPDDLIPYGKHFTKVRLPWAESDHPPVNGKLILVTGITPTAHGEGKTVTAIGLAQSMRYLKRKAVATLRQPSMGPIFGMKGGATGGGKAQVVPSELINLHFTGDFHAIAAAHNLLAAMVDAHIFHGNALHIDPEHILWPRTVDVNDRALRHITVCEGKGNGVPHAARFVITAASEVMAIFALASSYDDLRRRLSNITVALTRSGAAVRAADVDAVGAMMAILREALQPNLAQTVDGTPVFLHAGPFANIAHGTASVLSQRLALEHAEFVLNEAGFGADLGAEKYFDIVMPSSRLKPSAAVVVATVRALAAQGGGDLAAGLPNLGRHLDIVARFGVPAVVAINHFPSDTMADLALVQDFCRDRGVACGVSEVFGRGAEGGLDVAERVMEVADSGRANPRPLYMPEMPVERKLQAIARCVYGADGVSLTAAAQAQAERFTAMGCGDFPVCVVKTPLSFTEDPKRLGAPTGWTLPVTELQACTGAGFLLAIAGNTMRMPGLGKDPQARRIDLGPDGEILGVC
ncbi:MAG: formate--tetrahydrofolate ligase [Bryobacterales bacterium]|nr:formate--tetrahydrofolate ligase [Bryobacterales bacterium]